MKFYIFIGYNPSQVYERCNFAEKLPIGNIQDFCLIDKSLLVTTSKGNGISVFRFRLEDYQPFGGKAQRKQSPSKPQTEVPRPSPQVQSSSPIESIVF